MLRLFLPDQLHVDMAHMRGACTKQDIIYMFELDDYFTRVKHHKKKIAFILACMRHFAHTLQNQGYQVRYLALDDAASPAHLSDALALMQQEHPQTPMVLTAPSEYADYACVQQFLQQNPLVTVLDDDRFMCSIDAFSTWAGDKKQLRMEFFYRVMRKQHSILMDGDAPVGGKWNYDSENRKPPKQGLDVPEPYTEAPDSITQGAIDLVNARYSSHFGDMQPWYFATTRTQALAALDLFISTRLALFGDYQDAMLIGQPWMFHSHISFYLNIGLLLPRECIQAAEDAYRNGHAPLNATEGFIRQILGWREFIRGIYWLRMPAYKELNFLNSKRKLPPLYWGKKTHMRCLSECVSETQSHAYAHHIQRLMVLGNFALLAGLDPKEVNNWYWIVYADAHEWVELPNVSGMILFADGGFLGSKPYAASGTYINKMSDYCKGCKYKVSQKNGPDACPFNYLYWDFLLRNQPTLKGNQRLSMIYSTLGKMTEEKVSAIKDDSKRFLAALDNNETV